MSTPNQDAVNMLLGTTPPTAPKKKTPSTAKPAKEGKETTTVFSSLITESNKEHMHQYCFWKRSTVKEAFNAALKAFFDANPQYAHKPISREE